MSLAANLRHLAVALFGLIVLSACTVVVDDDTGPGPGPGYCTREYEPVCARRYGERRTFANACLADRAGYDIIRRGECRREGGDGGGGGGEQRFCTREYRPVCARRSGDFRTFGNACEADAAGWRVVGNGECGSGGGGGDEPRFCTKEYRPVCARRDGRLRTFGNACEADAAGWRVVGNGEC